MYVGLFGHSAVVFHVVFSCFCVLLKRKDDDDWMKKCMEYEAEGSRPREDQRGPEKRLFERTVQARKLNKEDAMDRCKCRKVIKEVR